jgi:hypothetical protein
LRSLRQSLPGLAKKGEKFFTFILKTSKFLQCKMAVQENKQSPIENLALVIKNCGESGATLQLYGKDVERGKDFRYGHRQRFQNHDLIIWIRMSSTKPVNIILSPTN